MIKYYYYNVRTTREDSRSIIEIDHEGVVLAKNPKQAEKSIKDFYYDGDNSVSIEWLRRIPRYPHIIACGNAGTYITMKYEEGQNDSTILN